MIEAGADGSHIKLEGANIRLARVRAQVDEPAATAYSEPDDDRTRGYASERDSKEPPGSGKRVPLDCKPRQRRDQGRGCAPQYPLERLLARNRNRQTGREDGQFQALFRYHN